MNPRAIEAIRKDCEAVFEANSETLEKLRPLKGDTLVITGGTGFVGTWLTEAVATLNDRYSFGTRVILVARSTDSFRQAKPHLASRADVTLMKSDVRHVIDLPKETGWLIHAAANPDTRFHSSSPIEAMSIVADGTAAILRAVDRCSNFKMLLNVSSGLVYGAQPWDLTGIPENFAGAPASGTVSSAYGEAKRYAETLTSAARSQARIPTINVRPFAFIGPHQSLDNPWAVTNFIRDALNQHPIKVQGDGQTVRSYMYPSDMAFWMLRMLTGAPAGATYNLGSEEGVTLESLAGKIAAGFSPRPEVRLRTATSSSAHPSRLVPNTTAAREGLGLRATVSLDEAIAKSIAWYRIQSA